MAILLIGSTGNGKSTLGNFLINPREEVLDKQAFKTAKGNLPQTQNVSQQSFEDEVSGKFFSVIDTPGLNESSGRDLKHMIQIVESLKEVDEVVACVFVVKFNSKIDTQYKTTVQYYSKLLSSLFEKNVIIVMTDYATDARSEAQREKQGIDVDQIKKNTVREIVESGSLAYEPLLFTIDCLPFDDDERQLNLAERKAILSKIAAQVPFTCKNLKVAKTQHLKSLDEKKIDKCEGEITGYKKRLQQADEQVTEALEKIQLQEQEITRKKRQLNSLIAEVNDKDTSELTEVASWSINQTWKLFRYSTKKFDVTPQFKIKNVNKWTNGHCEWKDYEETAFNVKGKVEGKFMRGVYASLSLETFKSTKYEREITSLRQRIARAENEQEILQQQLKTIKERFREYSAVIKLFQDFIDERRVQIKQLDTDYLTLDEAREKLKDFEDK